MRKLNKSELKRVYGAYDKGKYLIDLDDNQLAYTSADTDHVVTVSAASTVDASQL